MFRLEVETVFEQCHPQRSNLLLLLWFVVIVNEHDAKLQLMISKIGLVGNTRSTTKKSLIQISLKMAQDPITMMKDPKIHLILIFDELKIYKAPLS